MRLIRMFSQSTGRLHRVTIDKIANQCSWDTEEEVLLNENKLNWSSHPIYLPREANSIHGQSNLLRHIPISDTLWIGNSVISVL